VNYDYIDTDEGLGEFCDAIAGVPSIALDTEFVSEDRYFPELCLVQVAAGERHAVIDSLAIAHLDPFWRLVATPGRTVIVHAGREEHRFCRRAVGQGLATWFDTQIASGLIGLEYPASYATLIQKLLGKSLGKGETRTDWRRRPLSARQLEYALQDVVYLEPLHGEISSRLKTLDRDAWLAAELAAYQDRWEQEETAERWRRVAGISGLTARQLAVLHEIWRWRDGKARQRNAPPRGILRDDLMVELSRRASADPQRIRAVRGMDWRKQQQAIPEISEAIARGLAMPVQRHPVAEGRASRPQYTVLGQFLATAVNTLARAAQVAPGLVGSVQDVRDLIAHHLGHDAGTVPVLTQGWRAEVVGQYVGRLLDGELAIRIVDPHAHEPLAFEPMGETGNEGRGGS